MKILHVAETILGGVSTHLNELLPFQLASGHEVRLLVPQPHLTELSPQVAAQTLSFYRPSRRMGLLVLPFAFLRTWAQFRPDIVHVHSTFAGALIRPLAFLLGVPVVYCPHAWAMEREQSKFMHSFSVAAERLLAKITAKIVAVSESERTSGLQIGIAPEKIVTVFNGLRAEIPPFEPIAWEGERLKILYIGRLSRQKGIDVLLRAIDGLQETLSVCVIGEALPGDRLFDFSSFPHVCRLGWQKQPGVMAHMAASDLVVLPSRWEGLPYVALEAMRLGKPVVAARVGGLVDAVADGETGLLFQRGDAEALRGILRGLTRTQCEKLGRAGQKRFAEKFDARLMSQAIEEIYRAL